MGNRILKESIRRSPQIDKLSWFEEVVYYRMLTVADDFGRMDGRMVVLTHDLFPTKDSVTKAQVSRAVKNMISLGLLAEYQVDGAPYLRFPTWEKHQHPKRRREKYPAPPNGAQVADSCPPVGAQAADNEPPCGGQLADNCPPDDSPTRTRAVSVSESVSETPPAVVESEAREAPAPAAGSPDNPFAVSAPPSAVAGSRLRACGAAAPLSATRSSPSELTGSVCGADLPDRRSGNLPALVAPAGLPPEDDPRPSFDTLEVYAANNLAALTPGNMEELVAFKADMPEALIRHAIDEAAANGKRAWSYVRSILRRYLDAGYRTVGEVKAAEEARRAEKPSGSSPTRNYQQHSYSAADFGADFYYDPSKDYPDTNTEGAPNS